jgi:hypothetical protein
LVVFRFYQCKLTRHGGQPFISRSIRTVVEGAAKK